MIEILDIGEFLDGILHFYCNTIRFKRWHHPDSIWSDGL